jgi:hypothetical protein
VRHLGENRWEDDFGNLLVGLHSIKNCAREFCTIHNNSNHSMKEFPQMWRDDKSIMERICSHGVGHPDPDEISLDVIHGCDGCCSELIPPKRFRDIGNGE